MNGKFPFTSTVIRSRSPTILRPVAIRERRGASIRKGSALLSISLLLRHSSNGDQERQKRAAKKGGDKAPKQGLRRREHLSRDGHFPLWALLIGAARPRVVGRVLPLVFFAAGFVLRFITALCDGFFACLIGLFRRFDLLQVDFENQRRIRRNGRARATHAVQIQCITLWASIS